MKFLIGHRDSKGRMFWRAKEGSVHCWQPFRVKADYYDLDEVMEIVALAKELSLGETLIIERIIGSEK